MGKRVRLIYDLPIADRQSIYRLLVSSTYVVEDINCVGVYKNGRGEKILAGSTFYINCIIVGNVFTVYV